MATLHHLPSPRLIYFEGEDALAPHPAVTPSYSLGADRFNIRFSHTVTPLNTLPYASTTHPPASASLVSEYTVTTFT